MDLIDRLREAVDASGINRKTIARRANMSASKLSRLLRHQTQASIYDVETILEIIGRTMPSLFAADREIDVRDALRALTEYVDHNEAVRRSTLRHAAPKRPRSRTARPFLAAATPNAVLIDDGRPLPRKRIPDELWNRMARYAARVVGDSMIDAGIQDGDTVYFREHSSSNRPPRGKIIVCRVNTSVYVKRLDIDGEEKCLLSERFQGRDQCGRAFRGKKACSRPELR
jgi:SOS-response transcriptional repressor LexA